MAEPKQIIPAGCSKRDFAENLDAYGKGPWWAEEKYDGARYLAHVHKEITYFTGRRISKKTGILVDKTYNVPHLYQAMTIPSLEGTIFDGEITYPGSMVNSVTSVMGCTPDNAKARQIEIGYISYIMFDVIAYKGQDIRTWSQETRRTLLTDIYMNHFKDHPSIHISMLHVCKLIPQLWDTIMQQGGEGIVIKDREAPYGKGWVKVKKVLEDSVIVTGFTAGNGKYTGLIGAIQFGQYEDGVLITFGKCSGIDDSTRQWLTDRQEQIIGKVFDIKFQERFPSGKFREPRFLRWRDDLAPEDIARK